MTPNKVQLTSPYTMYTVNMCDCYYVFHKILHTKSEL